MLQESILCILERGRSLPCSVFCHASVSIQMRPCHQTYDKIQVYIVLPANTDIVVIADSYCETAVPGVASRLRATLSVICCRCRIFGLVRPQHVAEEIHAATRLFARSTRLFARGLISRRCRVCFCLTQFFALRMAFDYCITLLNASRRFHRTALQGPRR